MKKRWGRVGECRLPSVDVREDWSRAEGEEGKSMRVVAGRELRISMGERPEAMTALGVSGMFLSEGLHLSFGTPAMRGQG